MKITPHGAAGGEVTGSAFMVHTADARVLVDCGLFQGGKLAESRNRPPAKINRKLDAVVLTHGHLDHVGRLPLLVKLGYRGPVFATAATIKMTSLILRDSARLQEQDAVYKNRKRERAGEEPVEPLYNVEDAEKAISLLRPVEYGKTISVARGVHATWAEAGHMLGSGSIQLTVEEGGRQKRVIFSGDLGPPSIPVLRDFEPFHHADMVFIESTYGNRDHRPFKETVQEFVDVVKKASEARGKILVPTFAIGRAQLLLVLLGWMFRKKLVKPFDVFVDSPMAIEATSIYQEHPELYADELKEFLKVRRLADDLKSVHLTATADESRGINSAAGPCLVMAGAGMCNAGRILHHLKQNLWRPETHLLFVGYQGKGSMGRRLIEGAEEVQIHGQRVAVKAQIHTMGGFSAHAGQSDLLNWIKAMAPSKPKVVVVHGEEGQRRALATAIEKRFHLKTQMPGIGDTIEL